jgi:hypothetical protein
MWGRAGMARIEVEVRIVDVIFLNWERRGVEFVGESSPVLILEVLISGEIFGEPHCTNTVPSRLGQESLIYTAEWSLKCLLCPGKHKYADYRLWWSKKPRRSLSQTCLSFKELRENELFINQVRVHKWAKRRSQNCTIEQALVHEVDERYTMSWGDKERNEWCTIEKQDDSATMDGVHNDLMSPLVVDECGYSLRFSQGLNSGSTYAGKSQKNTSSG